MDENRKVSVLQFDLTPEAMYGLMSGVKELAGLPEKTMVILKTVMYEDDDGIPEEASDVEGK